ncbi:MAG: hypothetical protein FJ317_02740 [SAR202 cluster bacterium]|nr:hypothetical protein [SAR202 cluster bacterium]
MKEALAVAGVIQKANHGQPYDRIRVAADIGTTPSSSVFTRILASSSRYGLTEGNYNSARIALTPLGRAIVAPTSEEEHAQGLVAAALIPNVFSRFYRHYNGKKLPEEAIARNFFSRELKVHPELVAECFRVALENGAYAGILYEVGGASYVSLEPARQDKPVKIETVRAMQRNTDTRPAAGRIFVGHDGMSEAAGVVTALLERFGIAHGTTGAIGDETRPVSDAAASVMKECSSAVLIFGAPAGGLKGRNRDRMLMQLGAASMLFGPRVVALVEDGLFGDQDYGVVGVPFNSGRVNEVVGPLLVAMHDTEMIKVSG